MPLCTVIVWSFSLKETIYPKRIVKQMVDMLEQENPGCFDDPSKTFADLYMKSGLYIAEIVKRLFNSDGMKQAFPDEAQRLQHIFEKIGRAHV